MGNREWEVGSEKWQALRVTLYVLVLAVFLGAAIPSVAQDGSEGDDSGLKKAVTANDVNKIAKRVYCPVCESTPLDVCQTQACADWRDIIRQKLEEGASEQEIFDYFSNLYGDRVLAEPPREGFSLLLWLLPLIIVPLGAVFFSRYMRNLKATAVQSVSVPDTAVPDAAASSDYLARIEKELENN